MPLFGVYPAMGEGWLYGKGVFMPDRFGWPLALAITLSALAIFYFFVTWIENRSKATN